MYEETPQFRENGPLSAPLRDGPGAIPKSNFNLSIPNSNMETNTPETAVARTQSVINRSAVKKYALTVSRERRAGKFTRVSEAFLDNVEAQVEAAIRQIMSLNPDAEKPVEPDDDREFITGAALEKIRPRLNDRAKQIISGAVRRHPSVGTTLK